jgi:hypothetical protein
MTDAAGPALWYEYLPGADLPDDVVETWQGSHIVAEQNSWTTKRRAVRDKAEARKAALPAPAAAGKLPDSTPQTPPEA